MIDPVTLLLESKIGTSLAEGNVRRLHIDGTISRKKRSRRQRFKKLS